MRSHQHSLMGLKIQASQAPPINGLSILSMSHCEISFIVPLMSVFIKCPYMEYQSLAVSS